MPSIQITEGSDNIFLNISNFSDSQEQDIASAAGLNNLVGNNTEGLDFQVYYYILIDFKSKHIYVCIYK